MQKVINKEQEDKDNAKHGEFFFARYTISNSKKNERESPVFVISNDSDKEDVIVCSCTKEPARSDFDVLVQLKLPTQVRTNKIYTIYREQLLFRISQQANPDEYKKIIEKLKLAQGLDK
jgi:hypothetical protein